MARPKDSGDKPLTDTELQIMNVLWEAGAVSVHDVQVRLSNEQNKKYAYTTVSTLLRVLEKKSVVKSRKEGRGHIYEPVIAKGHYQTKVTDHLVKQVFRGQATGLIKNLLGNVDFSEDELDEVREILRDKGL